MFCGCGVLGERAHTIFFIFSKKEKERKEKEEREQIERGERAHNERVGKNLNS